MSKSNKTRKDPTRHFVSKVSTTSGGRTSYSLCKAMNRLNGSSDDNFAYYRSSPNLFNIYHEGYRQQVSQWPFNPLMPVITWLQALDERKVVGDFGCGEAQIAQTFPDRTVYSFDLVAANQFIIACNIAKVPIGDNTLDISIFCLSLMGFDWPMLIVEATRCLKEEGILHIVEVRSRFKDIMRFHQFIESLGYHRLRDVVPNESDIFIYCQYKLEKKSQMMQRDMLLNANELLLPCPYKRR